MVNESETLGGSLEDLYAFCAVIEFGTLSAAARERGETKGSISRRLSRLEQRLGVALLARTPRSVSATEEGTAFYLKARDALALLADASANARAAQDVPAGHLRLTAPLDLGVGVLPLLLTRFRAQYPQIDIELLLTDTPLDLSAHRIDLALRATPGNLPDMSYRASALVNFRIALYCSPDYLIGREPPGQPTQLAEHQLLACRERVGATNLQLNDGRGRDANLTLKPVMRTSDYASALQLLCNGVGIGPLPDLIARQSLIRGELVAILEDWQVATGTLYAISLGGAQAPARVRLFREFLRSELAALQQLT